MDDMSSREHNSALTTIDCRAHCNCWFRFKKGANQKYGLKGTAIVKAVLGK
jgi:hypothetical protein